MDIKSIAWFAFCFCFALEMFMPRLLSQPPPPPADPSTQPPPQAEPLPNEPKVDYDIRINRFTDPINIEYCQTCGFKARVDEVKNLLSLYYPTLIITETPSYPPFPFGLLAQILTLVRYAGILLLVAGDMVFQKLQMPYPAWYLYMRDKKLMTGLFLFFGVNAISSWLTSTGAFEVTYGSQLLYSGIAKGRMPQAEEILALIKTLIQP
ncbi:unnamed protein product [Blepharisma stoltei]|uniref:SelT-like protein n=1 Tax=Blepharisma stoltei TaxID=1481888 RepID=A0AAU9JIR4_9CILI|nr:unnamed protein product [Blepharisma stoltei]